MIPYLTRETDKVFNGWSKHITKEGVLTYERCVGEIKMCIQYGVCSDGEPYWKMYYLQQGKWNYFGNSKLPQNSINMLTMLVERHLI